jgi:hypothetical protein
MSTLSGGPNIVTNALVLYLDAANTQSFSGSGTSYFDLTSNRYTAILANGTSFSNTNSGIITLDGTNDYFYITHNGALSFSSGNFTICVWNKDIASPTGNYGGIITNDAASDNAWKIFKDIGEAFYKARSGSTIVNFPNYTVGKWHYYSFTFSSGLVTTYLDGVASGNTASGAPNPTTYNNIAFGSYRYNDAVASQYLHNQSIGPVQLYNRALSASEILQNYNAHKSRFGLS